MLEKAGAAADFVRQAEFAQLLFEGACLEVAAVEDGEIAVFFVVADFAQVDVLHDLFGFGFVAARADDVYALACRQLRPEFFFDDVRVVGNQGVGGGEDLLVAAVVLFQFDGFQRRVVFVQVGDVLRPRAAPGVDGLIVVADGGKCRARPGEQLQQRVLAVVGVLVFVNQEVTHAVLPALAHRFVFAQQRQRQGDEVVKIDGVIRAQPLVVVVVDVRRQHLRFVLRQRFCRRRADVGVFVGGNLRL